MLMFKRHASQHATIQMKALDVLLTTMTFNVVKTSTSAGAQTRWLQIPTDCELVRWLCMHALMLHSCVIIGCRTIAAC